MHSFIDDLLAADPATSRETVRARLRVAVAEALLLRMEDLGTTKAQLAEALDVSRSAVSQALTGNRNMSLNLLADMAAALKLTAQVVLTANAPTSQPSPAEQQRRLISAGNGTPAAYLLQSPPRTGAAHIRVDSSTTVKAMTRVAAPH